MTYAYVVASWLSKTRRWAGEPLGQYIDLPACDRRMFMALAVDGDCVVVGLEDLGVYDVGLQLLRVRLVGFGSTWVEVSVGNFVGRVPLADLYTAEGLPWAPS